MTENLPYDKNVVTKKQGIAKTKEFAEVKWAEINSICALIFIFGRSVFVPKKILGSFGLVLIFIFGTIAFVPYYFSYGAATILSLYLISSFVYGSIFYSFRKSTLTENIKETNLGKFDIYFSFFIIIFVFTAMVYLFILAFFIIGIVVNFPLFQDDFFFEGTDYGAAGHSIAELNAQLLVWWYVAFICLNFSLFYLFQNIVNTQKTFYTSVFFYFILLMMYGHTLYVPTFDKSFILAEEYSFLDKNSDNNIFDYFRGVDYDTLFLAPNINFPFDTSFHMEVDSMLAEKAHGRRAIFIVMNLLVPHYWINIYCANAMRSTCMFVDTANPYPATEGGVNAPNYIFWVNHPDLKAAIIDFKGENHPYVYSKYSFANARIWSFKNDIAWVLAMYLWIAYFALFTIMGKTISKAKAW